jgi:protease I
MRMRTVDFNTHTLEETSMAAKPKNPKGTCPCSQKVDRRDFLKVTAIAGMLAGCSPVLETPAPTDAPVPTSKPTLATGETAVPGLSGKKVLYVLPRSVYADQCHEASASVLKACGVTFTFSAVEKKAIPGFTAGSSAITPDLLVSEVNPADFDAVIFECGTPAENYNADLQNLARETVAQNKVLGAVCNMPALLAVAGVLKGKQATSNINDQYNLEQFGAVISEADPVRDGKIVTASFEGSREFGWLIAEVLAE